MVARVGRGLASHEELSATPPRADRAASSRIGALEQSLHQRDDLDSERRDQQSRGWLHRVPQLPLDLGFSAPSPASVDRSRRLRPCRPPPGSSRWVGLAFSRFHVALGAYPRRPAGDKDAQGEDTAVTQTEFAHEFLKEFFDIAADAIRQGEDIDEREEFRRFPDRTPERLDQHRDQRDVSLAPGLPLPAQGS